MSAEEEKNMGRSTDQRPTIKKTTLIVVVAGALGASAGAAILERYYGTIRPVYAASSATPAVQGLPDFINLAKKLGPSVVNVSTTTVRGASRNAPGPFGGNDPAEEFWERFFGGRTPRGPQRQSGVGSGFIVDSDGTILTNYHVVNGAQKLSVTLSDGQRYDAKVIGSDQKSDIAVIKIDAGRNLPAAALGDSDRLDVGEWVMAIGNPFGLDNTVTSGIVSAKGRNIGQGPYDNFIQTDASINPGNSGGPLINLRGEVVGINTAIFSQSGGNIGIGFAIPIDLVRTVVTQLKATGKVTRGWLGVEVQAVTPDIAHLFGLAEPKGVLISEVAKAGPAEVAGIRRGDIIISFNESQIKESHELPAIVARTPVGERAKVSVIRDGRERTFLVSIGELPTASAKVERQDRRDERWGMTVTNISPEIARRFRFEPGQEGVVVIALERNSSAARAGVQVGDVIEEVSREAIRSLKDFDKAMAAAKDSDRVLLLIRRGDSSSYLVLRRRD